MDLGFDGPPEVVCRMLALAILMPDVDALTRPVARKWTSITIVFTRFCRWIPALGDSVS
jgi:hypothetical protein